MPGNSTARSRSRKSLPLPKKPYEGFPLTPHSGGKWQKKIRGTIHYFGRWFTVENGKKIRVAEDGWQAAVAEYDRVKADLHAGRTPGRSKSGELTVGGLCNQFLSSKTRKLKAGELTQRMWQDYKQITDMLTKQFGPKRLVDDLSPNDFGNLRSSIADRCGVYRLHNEVVRVRSCFKFAVKNGLLEREVPFGTEFDVPGKRKIAEHREESDRKLFEADEIRLMLDTLSGKEVTIQSGKKKSKLQLIADPQQRACILLGINSGAGNTDLAGLQLKHLDLENRWLNYPRSKTGTGRRVPLWESTCEAIKLAIDVRRTAKSKADENCVFLSTRGTRLVRVGETSRTDYVGREFLQLLNKLHINGRRGLGLYSLRHTFATIALQTGDRDCVKALLGHVENDVVGLFYDERGPSAERRIAVVEYVRQWLYEGGAK